MSMETSEQITSRPTSSWSEALSSSSRVTSPHVRTTSTCSVCELSPRGKHAVVTATREELAENLRRNLADLDRLMKNIKG
ncbi:hypothetical protein ANCCAN_10679 [Ancylostoma caninum]|uniref:Uncharacterized protein n=1 Tax=Ancylostoma caninum TaxID=29170 RepID=A0A368GG33_ANCCA|nr:hypothetical protein ANCCAN_10679 [Ancylostoma caninum]